MPVRYVCIFTLCLYQERIRGRSVQLPYNRVYYRSLKSAAVRCCYSELGPFFALCSSLCCIYTLCLYFTLSVLIYTLYLYFTIFVLFSLSQVINAAILEQTFIVEYTNQMCIDCQKKETKNFWKAVVQVRQKV